MMVRTLRQRKETPVTAYKLFKLAAWSETRDLFRQPLGLPE
jgi:hypothetical protein